MKTTLELGVASKIAALLLLTIACHGLDEEGAKEQQCFPISKTSKIDMQWVGSVKKWYYPVMSRLDLFRTAKDLVQKDVSEAEVYNKGCFEFTPVADNGIVNRGFGGLSITTKSKPLDPGMERVQFSSPHHNGYSGICHTTLTDNKTFAFFACCASDNQMVWGVLSPNKTLSTETTTLIHEHAVSLGFNKEYFTAIKYDSCTP